MLELLDHAALDHARAVERLGHGLDLTRRHARLETGVQPVLALPLAKDVRKQRQQLVAMQRPLVRRDEARVAGKVRPLDHLLAEVAEHAIIADRQSECAVRGIEDLKRHDRRVSIAVARGFDPGVEISCADVDQHVQRGVEQGNVDELAMARVTPLVEGRENGLASRPCPPRRR